MDSPPRWYCNRIRLQIKKSNLQNLPTWTNRLRPVEMHWLSLRCLVIKKYWTRSSSFRYRIETMASETWRTRTSSANAEVLNRLNKRKINNRWVLPLALRSNNWRMDSLINSLRIIIKRHSPPACRWRLRIGQYTSKGQIGIGDSNTRYCLCNWSLLYKKLNQLEPRYHSQNQGESIIWKSIFGGSGKRLEKD